MLYTDNELTGQQRKEVEEFVELNPDLKEELNGLLLTRLEEAPLFTNFDKNILYKSVQESEALSAANFEEYLLLYIDNELSNEERRKVEAFVSTSPEAQKSLSLLQKTVLAPNAAIVFPDKAILYKHPVEAPVVPLIGQWRRLLAAASILLIAGLLWMNKETLIKPFQPGSIDTRVAEGKKPAPETKNTIEKTTPTERMVNTKENLVAKVENDGVEKRKVEDTSTFQKGRTKVQASSTVMKNEKLIPEIEYNPIQTTLTPDKEVAFYTGTKQNIAEKISTAPIASVTLPKENAVKPYIISQEAFEGEDDAESAKDVEAKKNNEGIAFLDADAPEKNAKGNFRGLFRKASRIINRSKNTGKEDGDSVIRIASFSIAKK